MLENTISVSYTHLYGPVVQIGQAHPEDKEAPKPQFATLMKGQSIETITLEEALKLFDLPRTIGEYEGKVMVAAVGRFGPFIRHDGKFVSIPKGLNPLSITAEEAIELIEAKKQKDEQRFIKKFDEDPEMEILNGRFGPYISYKMCIRDRGTRMNINGDLGYHILSTEKDQLNLWYSHRSTNGKPKDYDVKAKINDNLGGINYKHAFEKTIFSIGAKYGYSAFNYYGAALSDPTSSYAPSEDLLQRDRETNQVNQTIAATIGFESKEEAEVGYLLDLGYTNFSHKYGLSRVMDGPTEHTLEAKFDLNAGFNGNMRVGLGGLVEYFNRCV